MLTKSQLAVWTADLRANADIQGKGYLEYGDRFCCLGRICYLMKDQLGLVKKVNPNGLCSYDGSDTILPRKARDLLGIDMNGDLYTFKTGVISYVDNLYNQKQIPSQIIRKRTLAALNDDGFTFPEIADILDKFYPCSDDPNLVSLEESQKC